MDDYEKLRIEAWIGAYMAAVAQPGTDRETAYIMADNCVEALDERFGTPVKEAAPTVEVEPKVCAWRKVDGGFALEHFITSCGCKAYGAAPPEGEPCTTCGAEIKMMVTADDKVGPESCVWAYDPDGIAQTSTSCGKSMHPKHKVIDGTCLYCEKPVTMVKRTMKREEPKKEPNCKWTYDPAGHRHTTTACGLSMQPKHRIAKICRNCERAVEYEEAKIEEPALEDGSCIWTNPPGRYTYIQTSCGRSHHPSTATPLMCPSCDKSVVSCVKGMSGDVPTIRLRADTECVWSVDRANRLLTGACGIRRGTRDIIPDVCPNCKRPVMLKEQGPVAAEKEEEPDAVPPL